jgi:hypothetical protein
MNRANIKPIDLSENRCPEPSHFCKNLCSHARMSGLKEGREAVESDQGEIVKTGHSEAGILITSFHSLLKGSSSWLNGCSIIVQD